MCNMSPNLDNIASGAKKQFPGSLNDFVGCHALLYHSGAFSCTPRARVAPLFSRTELFIDLNKSGFNRLVSKMELFLSKPKKTQAEAKPSDTMAACLKSVFGFSRFRNKQEQVWFMLLECHLVVSALLFSQLCLMLCLLDQYFR